MQIQTYTDQECTIKGPFIDFPTLGDLTLTSGSVNSYTIGEDTVYFLRGAVALQGITTAPSKLYCQYTSDTNQTLYIKPSEGACFVRLNIKCGKRSEIDPSFIPANEYRYQCTVEILGLFTPGVWDSASSGGSNICVDVQYNFYTGLVNNGGKTYLCMFYFTTGNNVHGFFADGHLFNGSIRPRTKSQTSTVSPGGHYGRGTTIPGRMTFSDAPAAWSMINATEHGLRVYDVYPYNMELLYRRLWSKDVWQRFTNSRYSPISGILAYHRLPIAVHCSNSVQEITICGQDYKIGNDENTLGVVDDGLIPVLCNNEMQPGETEMQIPEVAGSFLDYSPYCSAVLHLPYIGNMPIDINKISGGSIAVRYWIDVCSGNCMAHVLTTDRDGSSIIYGEFSGNCAYKYPVTGNDQGGTAVLGAAAGAATAGMVALVGGASLTAAKVAAGAIGAASGIAQAELNADHHMQQVGSWPANTGTLCDPSVYLVITRPLYLTPERYPEIVGYPAGDGHTIQDFLDHGGGLLAGDIHADGIEGATESEKAAIEAALRGGIVL